LSLRNSSKGNEDLDNLYRISSIVFGNIDYEPLKRVSLHLLAHLGYHRGFIQENFPSDHLIFQTSLFKILKITDLPNISTEPNNCLIPSGIPNSVQVLQKIQSITEYLDDQKESLTKLMVDQQMLADLIPLSAAASGMMVGQRQLDELKHSLSECVRNAVLNSYPSVLEEERKEIQFDGYEMFSWNGKLRGIPESFKLHVGNQVPVPSCWLYWWTGQVIDSVYILPFKVLFQKYRQDVIAANELHGIKRSVTSRSITEFVKVMEWITTLDEDCKSLENYNALLSLRKCDNGAFIKELNTAWSKCWRKAESELLNVTRTQGGASSKRRKHDLSKLGIRSIYERICMLSNAS
jgi:hypothetical protein